MRNHPRVDSQPNELVHDSENILRGMIINIFESDMDKILNSRPAIGAMKDETDERDQHIDPSATTSAADLIVSYLNANSSHIFFN
jgi:hypothetical protein